MAHDRRAFDLPDTPPQRPHTCLQLEEAGGGLLAHGAEAELLAERVCEHAAVPPAVGGLDPRRRRREPLRRLLLGLGTQRQQPRLLIRRQLGDPKHFGRLGRLPPPLGLGRNPPLQLEAGEEAAADPRDVERCHADLHHPPPEGAEPGLLPEHAGGACPTARRPAEGGGAPPERAAPASMHGDGGGVLEPSQARSSEQTSRANAPRAGNFCSTVAAAIRRRNRFRPSRARIAI